MLPYVGPMLSHLGGYVGDMLAILGLCWGYVRQFKSSGGPLPTKCRSCLSARRALPTPPLKSTVFLHFSIFAASRFDMRNKPCKTQCFFNTSHTRSTVNYRGFSDPEVGRKWEGGPPVLVTRVGGRGRDRGSGQGPGGPKAVSLPQAISPLRRREGSPAPPPTSYRVLQCFWLVPFFGSCGARWINVAQHRPK